MNLKYLSGLLLLVSLTNKVFSQTENCSFKSTFEQVKGRIFDEDYKIPVLEFMESNKEEYLSEKNNRTLIIDFFFDETNKFNKTVDQFRTLLKDSLKLPTDLKIIYKFQKTRGSVFIMNESEQISIIHLNALFYSKDPNLLKELFGNGKLSRIDTTTSKLKNFTHEFIPFKNSDNKDEYLFLFRGKITGKGFACDPNEDIDIVNKLKKIYDSKYIKDCEKKKQEEAEENRKALLISLQKSNDSLVKVLEKYKKRIEKSTQWTLFSNFDFLVGGTSSFSDFIDDRARFKGQGISTSSGVCFFNNGSDKSGVFITGAFNVGSSNYELKRSIDYEFINTKSDYNSISLLEGYNERINSSFLNIPFGIGYQLKQKDWPIFFQFNLCGLIGFNKLKSNYESGLIHYRRLYTESNILVTDEPLYGLEENFVLPGKPHYSSNLAFTFGVRTDAKILYNFINSPISGFINFGLVLAKTKTNSNESLFISEYKNDFNSILNSFDWIGSLPLYLGLGITYELRNKISLK